MHILNLPGFPRSNALLKKESCLYLSYQLMLDVYHMQCLQNKKVKMHFLMPDFV